MPKLAVLLGLVTLLGTTVADAKANAASLDMFDPDSTVIGTENWFMQAAGPVIEETMPGTQDAQAMT